MFLPLMMLTLTSTCPPEGVSVLRTCYTDYFKTFNFTLFPDFATFSELLTREIDQGGLDVLEDQCRALNTLKTCLGTYSIPCVNGTVISNNFNVNHNDAVAYAGDYSEQSYYCNEGFDLMKQYFPCMMKMENSPSTTPCLTMAIGDIQSGRNCKGYNDMTYCMSQIYGETCGNGVIPLICNILQKDLQAQDDSQKCQWFDCSRPFPFNGTSF